jgi:hypothetical protein
MAIGRVDFSKGRHTEPLKFEFTSNLFIKIPDLRAIPGSRGIFIDRSGHVEKVVLLSNEKKRYIMLKFEMKL